MEEKLTLRVLGKPAVEVDGRPITDILAVKEQALLYYLAVTGQVHNRHALSGLFWGDASEQKAKTSLRVALSNLRKKIPDCLAISHLTVGLEPDSDVWLDTAEFEAANRLASANDAAALPQLETLVSLYKGEFLQDFFVEGTPAFEEWLLAQRGHYRQIALRALVALAERLMAGRRYDQALDVLAQWLAVEPWDEAAHRLTMLAQSRLGNFNAALAQYEQCCQLLEDELGVEPMPETTALYERIQLARQTPPIPLLPDDIPLVGRQAELTRLHQMLASPGCRLVTITGLGGVGKTRLALAAARLANQERAIDYLNGVVFVPLASMSTAEALPLALADALDLFLSGQSEPISDVFNFLAGREMLLVFDNFEQLTDGGGMLNQILQRCPDVKILVTSREPLQLAAEWRLSLEGLTHPPANASELNPEVLESYEAVQLFVQAARQVRPNFHLTSENVPLLQRLCYMVDGMPLALMLSAAWLRAISLSDIIEEVEKGLDILETSMRDAPERQRSMRVIFTQTWSLLNEGEKRVFPALSVFRGGFDAEAVTAVTGAKPWLLAGLVDRGLLQLNQQKERYTIHELTRQYAAEKLIEIGARETVGEQHSKYYLGWVAQYDPTAMGMMSQSAIAALRPDIDNIRQAWRRALTAEKAEWLGQSIDALAAYYEVTGLLEEAIQTFGGAAEKLSDSETAVDPAVRRVICSLLVKEMEFQVQRGDYEQARVVGERIMEKATREGMARFQGDVYRELGILERWAGQLKAAEKHLRQAAAIYEAENAERPLATALDWLGLVVSDKGLIEEALTYLERAAQLHAKVNNQRGKIFNKGQTAVVLSVAGRLLESLAYQLEVLDEYVAIGYPFYIARTANNIGLVTIELGEYESGLSYMERALQLQRQTGALLDSYNTLGNKGELHLNRGEYREARRCFEEAYRFFEEANTNLLAGENLWRLGKVYLEMGDYERAQTTLEHCQVVAPRSKDIEIYTFASGFLAQLYWRLGKPELMAHYFNEAAVPYDQVRRPLALAEFVYIPAALWSLEVGDVDSAVRLHTQMTPWLQNAGRNPAVFMSKLLQAKILLAQNDKTGAEGLLAQLLEGNLRPHEQAAAYYELWRMSGEGEYGRKARELYQTLTNKTPNIVWKERFLELVGGITANNF